MPGYIYRFVDGGGTNVFKSPPEVDSEGAPAQRIIINGKVAIYCNNDGSMARGTAGQAPPQDPYAPGWAPSPWEEEPQP